MNNSGISLCMITKDEEAVILSCITSVEHLVKEIIVVDTGSTDRTPELVLAKGGKLLKLTWNDDFAQARNFSLLQATCPWILVLDADEVLESGDQDYVNRLLSHESAQGYFVNILNIKEDGSELSQDQVVRLFRNKPDYRFEGSIHEQIAPSILRHNEGKGLRSSELVIKHRGYTETIISGKGKNSRNVRIIRKHLAENPNDHFLWYSLGLEHYQQGDITEGLKHLQKALGLMSGSEGYFTDVLLSIGSGYLKLADWNNLFQFTNHALVMFPHNPDLFVLRGLASLGLEKHQEAANDLQSGLKYKKVSIISVGKLYAIIGDIANLRDDSAAFDYYLCSLKSAPNDLYSLCQIIGLWQKSTAIFGLDKVSQFVSWEKMLGLYHHLKEREEYKALAPVLLLLCVYQMISEENLPQDWAVLHLELFVNLEYQASGKRMDERLMADLLLLAAKELKITTALLRKTFNAEFSACLNKSKALITELMLLYVMTGMSRYIPGLLLFAGYELVQPKNY